MILGEELVAALGLAVVVSAFTRLIVAGLNEKAKKAKEKTAT
jgi:hypothetical protein